MRSLLKGLGIATGLEVLKFYAYLIIGNYFGGKFFEAALGILFLPETLASYGDPPHGFPVQCVMIAAGILVNLVLVMVTWFLWKSLRSRRSATAN